MTSTVEIDMFYGIHVCPKVPLEGSTSSFIFLATANAIQFKMGFSKNKEKKKVFDRKAMFIQTSGDVCTAPNALDSFGSICCRTCKWV